MKNWYNNFENGLETALSKMNRMEARYLNVSLFFKTAKQIDKHSEKCTVCQSYKDAYQKALSNFQSLTKENQSKTQYENLLMNVHSHLKKAHHIRANNYFASVYAIEGGVSCLLLAAIIVYFALGTFQSVILFYGLFLGLMTGYVIGFYKDKKMKKQGKTL